MHIISRFCSSLKHGLRPGASLLGIALGFTALAAIPADSVSAQNRTTQRLKTAIVFNILRFVDFPGPSRSKIRFCVNASDTNAQSFRAFNGKMAGAREVKVSVLGSQGYDQCDVVYLGDASAQAIAQARGEGRLVMGDGRGFVAQGGTVGLVRMGSQVRFEVNLGAADAHDLRISSKLIRLAARVVR